MIIHSQVTEPPRNCQRNTPRWRIHFKSKEKFSCWKCVDRNCSETASGMCAFKDAINSFQIQLLWNYSETASGIQFVTPLNWISTQQLPPSLKVDWFQVKTIVIQSKTCILLQLLMLWTHLVEWQRSTDKSSGRNPLNIHKFISVFDQRRLLSTIFNSIYNSK